MLYHSLLVFLQGIMENSRSRKHVRGRGQITEGKQREIIRNVAVHCDKEPKDVELLVLIQ
jgi:hypothetical protein